MGKSESIPSDPQGWLEYVKNIDLKDHKKAAIGVGIVAALGVGVGVYTAKNGKKFFIAYGDRHKQAKGYISVGEIESHGSALSAFDSEEAVTDTPQHDLFSMDAQEGFGYPGENPEDGSKYLNVAKKILPHLIERFSSSQDEQYPPRD